MLFLNTDTRHLKPETWLLQGFCKSLIGVNHEHKESWLV